MKENIFLIFGILCLFAACFVGGMTYEAYYQDSKYEAITIECIDSLELCNNDFNNAVSIAEECIESQNMLILTTWRLCKEETCGE